MTSGIVVQWREEEGWGSIRSTDVPGDVFAHYSMIVGVDEYRSLEPGQAVRFTWEQVPQDGFGFRAIEVFVGDNAVPDGRGPAEAAHSDAYGSHLRIEWDRTT